MRPARTPVSEPLTYARVLRMPLLRSRCHALTRHDPIRQPMRITAMRIAQVAPLAESVPPKLYGGTERVVSWLTEELVEQGHDVTLFASADSRTAANLVPIVPKAL